MKALARLWGVQESYHDIEGNPRHASRDALVAILAALGAPIPESGADATAVDAAVRLRHRQLWERAIEPVNVAWDGHLRTVLVRLPAPDPPGTLTFRLEAEDGQTATFSAGVSQAVALARSEVDGGSFVALDVPVHRRFALGYHRLWVEGCGIRGHTLVIAAPRHAFAGALGPAAAARGGGSQRLWGVFAPLYALSSKTRPASMGIGDVADLRTLLDLVADLGGDLVATLPLLPTFLDEQFEPSPYSPVSRRFWNEIFIDLGAVPEVAASTAATEALHDGRQLLERSGALQSRLVDYAAVARAKRRVLSAAAAQLLESGSPRRAALERFAAGHPLLDSYAAFRAACEHFRTPWQRWPDAARAGHLDDSVAPPAARHFHRYVQWIAETQLAEASRSAGAVLLFDLPLGGHPAGYDVWRERDLFLAGLTTGAPPDPLNLQGQDWGNPPLHPDRLRETGYAYAISCIRHLLAHSGVLRVDHVMGLHRAFVLPRRELAHGGAYLRYHPAEAYAILCLESHRARGGAGAMIVGEDLGTVPAYIRREMAAHGIYRCYVAQFAIGPGEQDGHAVLDRVPRDCLASLNTHDVAPFAAWWRGTDLEVSRGLGLMNDAEAEAMAEQRAGERARLVAALVAGGLLAAGTEAAERQVLEAWLTWLAASDARAVVVSLEDLWGETGAQNLPGTVAQHPNWRRRLALSMEDIGSAPSVVGTLAEVHNARGHPSPPGPAREPSLGGTP